MNRIAPWAVAILITANAPTFALAQQAAPRKTRISIALLARVASTATKLEELKQVCTALDDITRVESEKIATVVDRGFRAKGQLVAGTSKVDVVVEQTVSFWRGSVTQQLTMPCTATLAIDLDKLLANATYDPITKTIEVYLPPLAIIAVESHTSKYAADPAFSGGCWEWYDSGTARELELNLLKSDWAVLAREKVDPNAGQLRESARKATTQFLKGLLEPINPNLNIVVNS